MLERRRAEALPALPRVAPEPAGRAATPAVVDAETAAVEAVSKGTDASRAPTIYLLKAVSGHLGQLPLPAA